MTLKECLMTIDKDIMVYLGSKNGTAYFKIEECGKLIDELDDLDSVLLKRKQENLARSISDVERFPITIERFLKDRSYPEEYRQKKVAYYKHEIKKAKDRIKSLEEDINNWIPVGEREVFNKYERHDDIPGISIIVQGEEPGRYWFYREQFYGKIEEE